MARLVSRRIVAPGVVDYVKDGKEGFLVDAGDVAAHREAVLRLAVSPELRAGCEQHAHAKAATLIYAGFAARLAALCSDVGAP